jgi:phosphoglycolate phosphatase-like HAD superfamily hydrolase
VTERLRDVAALFESLRAVVFDFDGVLVDSVGIKSAAFAGLYPQESDAFRDSVVRHHLAHGGISRMQKIAHFEQLRTGRPAASERVDELAEQFAELVTERVISAPEMQGALELLGYLYGRFPLFVCSGTPEPELRRIVRSRGWDRYFDGVFGSPREKKVILRSIAASLRCPLEDILMIGDASTDLESSLAVGARFVFVGAGPGIREKHPISASTPAEVLRQLVADS